MALTELQRTICKILAENRIAQGESYVAGGAALNYLTGARRISRDIDLFHDTRAALEASWEADCRSLKEAGLEVSVVRERIGYVEARVTRGVAGVLMQWTQDSAFRFFPLVRNEDLGLVLHPFDLATNKVLALVGRLEARDWIDVVTCHERIQPLGYLAWAACGKDPGFNPISILDQAGRSVRYSREEVQALAFEGDIPDTAEISRKWRSLMEEAREIIDLLPPEHAGKCVMTKDGDLFVQAPAMLGQALERGMIRFHPGRIKGTIPTFSQESDQ